jgi:predicted YcjX-like family ATPase
MPMSRSRFVLASELETAPAMRFFHGASAAM